MGGSLGSFSLRLRTNSRFPVSLNYPAFHLVRHTHLSSACQPSKAILKGPSLSEAYSREPCVYFRTAMITVRLSTGLAGVAERALGFLVWRRWQFFDARVGVDVAACGSNHIIIAIT